MDILEGGKTSARQGRSSSKTIYRTMEVKDPDSRIHRLFESGATSRPLDEILYLLSHISPKASDREFIGKVHTDIQAFFCGEKPGVEANINGYHNFRHTSNVVLATARLLHALHLENRPLPQNLVLQALLAAYFHDLGLLPQTSDTSTPTGNHEQRSMALLGQYLRSQRFPKSYEDNCLAIIQYTNLDTHPDVTETGDRALHLCGQIVGTADLLAQMADRYYIESLPLLFQEHLDSGVDRHVSAVELMSNTLDFHEKVIRVRLENTLGNLAPSMQTHFRERFQIDKNLYLDNIDRNLSYLATIIEHCEHDLSCWEKYLRRLPPE